MKKLLLILFVVLLPTAANAADPLLDRPHWSLEAKAGRFIPALEDWATYYGKRYTGQYGGSLAYKILRQIEAGIEAGTIKDRGGAWAPLHGISVGRVNYELYPLNVFVLLRGVFSERQWVVPYIGGGWSRLHYKIEIEGQGISRGKADGSHYRGGLQFLLDGIDPSAANSLYLDYGVFHTYFFIEAVRTKASAKAGDSSSVDLGGTSYLAGLLFEF